LAALREGNAHVSDGAHDGCGGIHEIRSELENDLTRVPNYNLVLDKPLWVDTDLSVWDREIIQLADIAAFLVTKLIVECSLFTAETDQFSSVADIPC
jgi:hypothetical protein